MPHDDRSGTQSSRGARAASNIPWMERFSINVARWTGSTPALIGAFAIVLVWLACGPIFHYSDAWQLTINTGTTIITFLMVFVIQRAQNKDASATALKLNELIAALEGASNRLIDLEDLSEAELRTLHEHFHRLVILARKDNILTRSHTVEEADERHRWKVKG